MGKHRIPPILTALASPFSGPAPLGPGPNVPEHPAAAPHTPIDPVAWAGGKRQTGTPSGSPKGPPPAPCLPDVLVDLQQHLVVPEIRVPPAVRVGVEGLQGENKLPSLA